MGIDVIFAAHPVAMPSLPPSQNADARRIGGEKRAAAKDAASKLGSAGAAASAVARAARAAAAAKKAAKDAAAAAEEELWQQCYAAADTAEAREWLFFKELKEALEASKAELRPEDAAFEASKAELRPEDAAFAAALLASASEHAKQQAEAAKLVREEARLSDKAKKASLCVFRKRCAAQLALEEDAYLAAAIAECASLRESPGFLAMEAKERAEALLGPLKRSSSILRGVWRQKAAEARERRSARSARTTAMALDALKRGGAPAACNCGSVLAAVAVDEAAQAALLCPLLASVASLSSPLPPPPHPPPRPNLRFIHRETARGSRWRHSASVANTPHREAARTAVARQCHDGAAPALPLPALTAAPLQCQWPAL